MERLTRAKDQYPCRIAGGCPAEDWIEGLGYDLDKMEGDMCSDCPFEEYINTLADYEDCLEKMTQCITLAKEIMK